jgi:hypothetical protein
LGVSPSLDNVLSNAASIALKFKFNASTVPYPDVIVLNGTLGI